MFGYFELAEGVPHENFAKLSLALKDDCRFLIGIGLVQHC